MTNAQIASSFPVPVSRRIAPLPNAEIAEQMVSREIKADDYDKLVDEFIRNAGEEA